MSTGLTSISLELGVGRDIENPSIFL